MRCRSTMTPPSWGSLSRIYITCCQLGAGGASRTAMRPGTGPAVARGAGPPPSPRSSGCREVDPVDERLISAEELQRSCGRWRGRRQLQGSCDKVPWLIHLEQL